MCFRLFTFNFNNNDLVTAEDRYYTYQSYFENHIPKYTSHGQSPSSEKLTAFNIMCDKVEVNFLNNNTNFMNLLQNTDQVGNHIFSILN